MKRKVFLLFILLISFSSLKAKTDKFGTWIELEFTKEFSKKWEFSVIPEFRFQDDFSIDEYIFEGKLAYKPYKFLELATSYRYNTNVKNKGNEISHGVVFDITGSKEFGRFDASLRTRFTNSTDSDDIPWETFYFRPRIKVKYNIKGIKLEPFVDYELFHNLKQNNTYKGRFDIGATRNLGEYHRIGIYYRLQDYFSERNSIHILGIDYRFKF